MGSRYGIASALSDIDRGYEQEEDRQAKKAAGAQSSEMNRMKLEEMRGSLKKENSADALRLMIGGDIEGSMAKYNEAGEDKMTELEFDQQSGLVSWIDGKGEEQAAMLPHLMAMVGLNPKDLDTPEAKMGRDKELIEHKAKMAKQYGIGRGGKDKRTAYIQNLEYTMKKLTGGDARKAFQLMQLSKSDPQTAYSRILIGLQKQNQEAFGEDKMTDDEMRRAAKDSVTSFREEMFNELLGEESQTPAPAPQAEQQESVFNQGGQDSDPLKLY